ncbi:MAG: hypothetical protein VZS44_02395 [Bacilli bacterium]|nr:hypothetical protein [Bacilli bacterium]
MENLDSYYISELKEKIYHANNSQDELKIHTELEKFFSELISRKRYDSEEEGLQACMVVFPDKFAAKIAEGDGLSSHFVTSINLVEYLNDKGKYLSNTGSGYYGLSKEERRELYNSLQFRIIDNPDELTIAITSSVDISSSFQFDVLKDIILLCNKYINNNEYKNISIGLSTPSINIDFDDWSALREQLFIDTIDKSRSRL